MKRQLLSWGILAVVWLVVAAGAKSVFVEMELDDWWRNVALIPVVFLFYYSGKCILTWGGAWRIGFLALLQSGLKKGR